MDGREQRVETMSFSVGQLLSRRGIAVGPNDSVTPHPGTALRDGTRIVVQRAPRLLLAWSGPAARPAIDGLGPAGRAPNIEYRDVTVVEPVAHATRVRYDPRMSGASRS